MSYLDGESLVPLEIEDFKKESTVKGVIFRFLAIFQNSFSDSWDIHGMQPIILGYFFNDYDRNTDILIKNPIGARVAIIQFFKSIFKGPMTGVYWYNYGLWAIILLFS